MKTTRSIVSFALLTAALFLTACTSTAYKSPEGATFTRTSFFNKQSIGKVEFAKTPTGEKLLIQGYSNDQSELAAAVAGAVATALAANQNPVAK